MRHDGIEYDDRSAAEHPTQKRLSEIRDGRFYLRLNRKGKCVQKGSYTVLGQLIEPVYQPRWEVWERSLVNSGVYKVMTLATPQGNYREPGEWVVELLEMFNPERYGGDLEAMLNHIEANSEKVRMGQDKSETREMGLRLTEAIFDQSSSSISNISGDKAKSSRHSPQEIMMMLRRREKRRSRSR